MTLLSMLKDYHEIHPLRFWAWGAGFLVIGIIIYLVIIGIIKYRGNANSIKDSKAAHKGRYGIRNRFYILGFSFIAALLIGGTVLFIGSQRENTWISNSDYIFGIDVSHYQGNIEWSQVKTSHHPIEFVFIRATMGSDGKDQNFKENWLGSLDQDYVRGAYHYYRPFENSTEQFDNFSSVVSLAPGDFPPILDIEKPSEYGAENLRRGVKNWLSLAEQKYGIKPVIYTGRSFYKEFLEGYVDGYPLWIASYSNKNKLGQIDWDFHQFTENVRVKGISEYVDGNDFKGELDELKQMCIQ